MKNWNKPKMQKNNTFSEKRDSNKLNEDPIERENDNGNKKDRVNKRKENDKCKSNSNNNSMEKPKIVYALGDSMLEKLNDYLLAKRWDKNTLSKFDSLQVLKSVACLIMSNQPYEVINQIILYNIPRQMILGVSTMWTKIFHLFLIVKPWI